MSGCARATPHPLRRKAGCAVVACLVLATPACAADVCQRAPSGSVTAFVDVQGEVTSFRFAGRLLEALPPTAIEMLRYRFRDESDREIVLSYRSPLGPLPLQLATDYDLRVDHVGGAPDASGLAIRDGTGLLFAAAAGQRIGWHALAEGLEGFSLALESGECGSRLRDRCYDAIHNMKLRVSHAGATALLHNGESARLGRYRVHCLTAQRVSYSKACADAGLHAYAYVIQRAP